MEVMQLPVQEVHTQHFQRGTGATGNIIMIKRMKNLNEGEKKSERLTKNISQVHFDMSGPRYKSSLSKEDVRTKWLTPCKKKSLAGAKRPREPDTIRSFVTTDQFSVRVTKVTSKIGV